MTTNTVRIGQGELYLRLDDLCSTFGHPGPASRMEGTLEALLAFFEPEVAKLLLRKLADLTDELADEDLAFFAERRRRTIEGLAQHGRVGGDQLKTWRIHAGLLERG